MIQRTVKKNIGMFAVIAGLVCVSGFYKIINAESDLSPLPVSGQEVNSVFPAEITTSTGIEFVLIPAGKFVMWYKTVSDESRIKFENYFGKFLTGESKIPEEDVNLKEFASVFPRMIEGARVVTISKPFYLGKYEIRNSSKTTWTNERKSAIIFS